ncbi:MAG: hypothetical protein Pars93KO_27880 [Parasphingorhabdus sp.]
MRDGRPMGAQTNKAHTSVRGWNLSFCECSSDHVGPHGKIGFDGAIVYQWAVIKPHLPSC